MICGFNGYNLQTDRTYSYHFDQGLNVWGWASWRRVWEKYSIDMKPYADKVETICNSYPPGERKAIRKDIMNSISCIRNGCDTWDVQLSVMLFANHYLNIVPRERLITNHGCEDSRAAHTTCYMFFAQNYYSQPGHIEIPLRHPPIITVDTKPRHKALRLERGFLNRGSSCIATRIPRLRNLVDAVCKGIDKICPILFQI